MTFEFLAMGDARWMGVRQPAKGLLDESRWYDTCRCQLGILANAFRVKMCRAERNGDCERAPNAGHAVDAYGSTMEFDEFIHQRQADTGALVCPAPGLLNAVEALEHARQFVSRYAHTGVANRQSGMAAASIVDPIEAHLDFAFEREFE